jgi:hypothetical protein
VNESCLFRGARTLREDWLIEVYEYPVVLVIFENPAAEWRRFVAS